MALPKMDIPTFELELPSSGKKVKYRPFLVKEHKLLMMMKNAEGSDISKIVGDLITACTFGKVDGFTIPSVDAEYLFLNIRARSIGEVYDFIINCECGNKIDASANVDDLIVVKPEGHTTKIALSNSIGVEMTYPVFGSVLNVYQSDDTETTFEMINSCIKAVYTPEEYTEIDENNKEELKTFIEGLTKEQFDKIEAFFVTTPFIKQVVTKKCDKCEKENTVEIRGLENFFI